jgi:hypothetical protein
MFPMSTKKKATLITSEHPKGIRATSLFHAKYNKARLNSDRAQRLNESGEFWTSLEMLIQQHSATNQYANEEVASSCIYPPGYAPKPLEAQIAKLRNCWPKLKPGKALIELERQPLVSGAEAIFAFVRFQALAPTYNDALVKEMLPALAQLRNGMFYNYRNGQLGSGYLHMSIRTTEALEVLFEQQKSDILVAPMQLGMAYRGKSIRRARELFGEGEFGSSSLMAGSILVVHPEREVQWEQLHMDCAGDEFSPKADGTFPLAPLFFVCDGKLFFDTYVVSNPLENFGSASTLLPQ